MAATSLDNEILRSLQLLGNEEKASLLGVIKSFLNLKKNRDDEVGFDVEAYNREMDEAEADSERDGFVTQEDVEMQLATWKLHYTK